MSEQDVETVARWQCPGCQASRGIRNSASCSECGYIPKENRLMTDGGREQSGDRTEQDWREAAYLKRSNWPEAIPPMGPQREFGPYPWGQKLHHDPHDLDDYPACHADAASVGYEYGGDVCPYCGVPLANTEEHVDHNGNRGTIWDLARDDVSVPVYHEDCWQERQAEKHGLENTSLGEFVTEGGRDEDADRTNRGVPCPDCPNGRLTVSDAVYADCNVCDAAVLRNEVGL